LQSILVFKKNIRSAWLPMLLEVIFFLLFGIVLGPLQMLILNNLEELGGRLIQDSPTLDQIDLGIIMGSENFKLVILFLVILALIFYLLYGLFQGLIWRFSMNYVQHGSWKKYIKRFYGINIFWLILFSLLMILDFIFSYIDTVGERLNPEGTFFLGKIGLFLFILLLYFMLPGYLFIEKNTIKKSIMKSIKTGFSKRWFFHFLLLIVIFGIFEIIFRGLVKLENASWIILVVGLVFILPLMIISRIYLRLVVQNEG